MPARTSFVTQIAAKLLRDVGLRTPPVSVQRIGAFYGYRLAPIHGWPQGQHSAQWQPMLHEIRFNAEEPEVRQRFSIVHEVGHAQLGHGVTTFSSLADPESDDYAADPDRALEAEADQFAREVLMPPEWIREDWARGLRWRDLARRYFVSEAAVAVAIDRYRLVKP